MSIPIKLKDFGCKLASSNTFIMIEDNDGKRLYVGPNPFTKNNPQHIQAVYPYLDRDVMKFDVGVVRDFVKSEFECNPVGLKIVVESNGLFYVIGKTLNEERAYRVVVSVYKNGKALKDNLLYINSGSPDIDKVEELIKYRQEEVKNVESGYTEKGWKEYRFYI